MAAGDSSLYEHAPPACYQFLFLFSVKQRHNGFRIQPHHLLIATDYPHFVCRDTICLISAGSRYQFFFH